MAESMTESMAGNMAGSTPKGKRKAEDGVRKSESDAESDMDEIRLMNDTMNDLAKRTESVAKVMDECVELMANQGAVMKVLKERKMRHQQFVEELEQWVLDNIPSFAVAEKTLGEEAGACNERSQVMKTEESSKN